MICSCESCRKERRTLYARIFATVACFIVGCLLGFILAAATGCTVIPPTVVASQVSFDGNEQNSGVLRADPAGFVVTAHYRDRYNGLIADYGRAFSPALEMDAGLKALPGGEWLIDREHAVKMIEMNAWRHAGRPKISN